MRDIGTEGGERDEMKAEGETVFTESRNHKELSHDHTVLLVTHHQTHTEADRSADTETRRQTENLPEEKAENVAKKETEILQGGKEIWRKRK